MIVVRLAAVMAVIVAGGSSVARAAEQDSVFANPGHFEEQGGEAIYHYVCTGCHMPDGRGAAGAGAYPALAADSRLLAAGYPVAIILHGQKAMPPLGAFLSDAQIADVVNFVRTHFGNDYPDVVTEAQVKAAR